MEKNKQSLLQKSKIPAPFWSMPLAFSDLLSDNFHMDFDVSGNHGLFPKGSHEKYVGSICFHMGVEVPGMHAKGSVKSVQNPLVFVGV